MIEKKNNLRGVSVHAGHNALHVIPKAAVSIATAWNLKKKIDIEFQFTFTFLVKLERY